MRRLTCFVGLLFVLPCFARADIIVGTNNFAKNVYPFGDSYVGEYQQVYTSAAFPGLETITGLEFASGSASGNTGSHTVTLTIGLSTTSATVASMSTNYAANKGADFTQIFSGTVTYTPASNDTFDLIFPTAAFLYNPGLGNLLLDVVVASNSGSQVAFDATIDSVTSRVFNDSGNGAPRFASSHGLVTDFVTVSEPASVLLLGSVVVLLRTALRHKPPRRRSGASAMV
jgi:hypothetical protein